MNLAQVWAEAPAQRRQQQFIHNPADFNWPGYQPAPTLPKLPE